MHTYPAWRLWLVAVVVAAALLLALPNVFGDAPALHLSRSEFVPDYELCLAEGCLPMSHWLPSDGGLTVVTACVGDRR